MLDQNAQISAQGFFHNPPLLHTWDGGQTWNAGGFTGSELESIVTLIRENFPAPKIIETGCGNSTIAFLLSNPSEVVSICPDGAVFDRIEAYYLPRSIPTDTLHQIVACSEWEHFDFALIDGSHNWPSVFVDFCYVHAMTRKGSLIMVDDFQLHSARELANLLMEQPGFSLETRLPKSLIFRKTTDETQMPEWYRQPYIVRQSKEKDESSLRRSLRKVAHRLPWGRSLIKAITGNPIG